MRRAVAIIIPVVSLIVAFSLLYLLIPRPQPSVAPVIEVPITPLSSQPPAAASLPKQLEIPGLAIVAAVYPIGLTVDGDMAINEIIDEVAWYQHGPVPGETGSAVIAGHYGWKEGVASVFTKLHTVKEGDEVVVRVANGDVKTFIVRAIRNFLPDDDTTEVFRSTDGKAHLNLITCEGVWDAARETYSERLVVFTDLVE